MLAERSIPTFRRVGAFAAVLVAVAGVAAVGRSVTDTGPSSWYATLAKPAWEPPGWALGVVWTVLYVTIAVAAWLWWREGIDARPVLAWWTAQLILNMAWTLLFFGLEQPGWALAEIIVLDLAVVATIIVGWQVRRAASLLLLPYLAWIGFATALNAAIVLENR